VDAERGVQKPAGLGVTLATKTAVADGRMRRDALGKRGLVKPEV